jgi:NAD(P)-dependent dehydrogenase (short-subunit alcohol dehydrogenase family)
MIAGGNWWRANEIVTRHLTRQAATRYRCGDRAGAGQAIAIGLAEVGADVALFDLGASWRRDDAAEAIADRCRRYLKLTGDVSDAEVVACALTSTAVQMGPCRLRLAARGCPMHA